MKRILIPAFFVVDLNDDEHPSLVNEIAMEMQYAANQVTFARRKQQQYVLLLDEEIQNREVPIAPNSDLPHTFNWNP